MNIHKGSIVKIKIWTGVVLNIYSGSGGELIEVLFAKHIFRQQTPEILKLVDADPKPATRAELNAEIKRLRAEQQRRLKQLREAIR